MKREIGNQRKKEDKRMNKHKTKKKYVSYHIDIHGMSVLLILQVRINNNDYIRSLYDQDQHAY